MQIGLGESPAKDQGQELDAVEVSLLFHIAKAQGKSMNLLKIEYRKCLKRFFFTSICDFLFRLHSPLLRSLLSLEGSWELCLVRAKAA